MITRRTQFKPFTTVGTDIIFRGGMTPEELGVYTAMSAKPDNWDFNEQVLARELHISQAEVHRILKGLERKGYVRERMGRFGATWDFYETPFMRPDPAPKIPEPETPAAAKEPEQSDKPSLPNGDRYTAEEKGRMLMDFAKQLAARHDLNRVIRG